MSLLPDTKEETTMDQPIKRRKLFTDVATLVVGPEKQVFKMHKELLCSVSPYFKAALEGDFKEAQEQKIELAEDDPETIEYFQLWLYMQSILDKEETVSSINWGALIKLYLLGETRLITTLQNQVIDLMIRKMYDGKKLLGHKLKYEVFDKTSPGSPLRKLIAEVSAQIGVLPEWKWSFVDGGEVAQRDFLKDLVLEMYRDRATRQEQDFWKIRCSYHIHAEGEARCSEDTPNPDTVLPRN
ncbi:hypothetical protein MMC17_002194 [Xylographa soralifera]|nr:hypothetical protein [Xylographa soralifera]